VLPSDEFTLEWQHSVEKTRWEEHYRLVDDRLELTQAGVQGLGAGMEPAADAVLEDGWWRWKPDREALAELRLTYSTCAGDYRVCWRRRCLELAPLLGRRSSTSESIQVRGCASPDAKLRRSDPP
jgi:hypothetical protein